MQTAILVEYNPKYHTLILTATKQSDIRLLERLANRERGVFVVASGTEKQGQLKIKATLELQFRGVTWV